ncbi:MAG: endo-1,4-beta-xylanase [Lachnospiraceae bacterium]|nr:endo-1,4-beta-xylanase [Lachnospiraceae bacterium]
MKQKLIMLLIAIMVCSFAGCSSKNSDENVTPSVTQEPTAAPSGEITPEPDVTEAPTATLEPTPTEKPTATPTPTPDPAEGKQLKDLFAEHGMKVGTCLNTQMIDRAVVKNLLLTHFNSVTMENSMKPDYLFNKKKSQETGELVVEFNSDALKMMKWAQENNYSMRGHTLIWYSQTPDWIFHVDFDQNKDLVDRDTMLKRMEGYIKNVFAALEELGYIDIFYAYDVVNEAWMENGTVRQNRWTQIIGEDYLWYAFYYADKYAPETIDLYYNDYNEQFKTLTLYNFVNTLVDEDGRYLIDGIGLQAHLYTTDNLDQYFKTVDKLGETGLKLQLTELDVCLGKYQAPKPGTDENLRKQGCFYYDLINGLFERVDSGKIKMDALTFWGITDSMSWRKEYKPLLYDTLYKPKYSLYGAFQMKEYAGFDN